MSHSKIALFRTGLVIAAAPVQLVPAAAAVNPALLHALYGTAPVDPTTLLMLRHRAVLLGLVGVVLPVGALAAGGRKFAPAIVLGLASKVSYLALFAIVPATTAEAARVARADSISSALLLLALALGLRRA